MTTRTAKAALGLSCILATSSAAAGDRALGAYLSSECATCHQVSGRPQGGIPAIAGLPEHQFVASMEAYRKRQRDNQIMQVVASRLSPDEIAALASYYGSLKARD
jgi:cytochrome c553